MIKTLRLVWLAGCTSVAVDGGSLHTERLAGSLLAILVFQTFGTDISALGRFDSPFFAIRVIAILADRVVSDHIVNKVLCAVVDELMWFVGWKDERVAGMDAADSFSMPHLACSRHDQIDFPLSAMQVVREISLAGWQAT